VDFKGWAGKLKSLSAVSEESFLLIFGSLASIFILHIEALQAGRIGASCPRFLSAMVSAYRIKFLVLLMSEEGREYYPNGSVLLTG
jgi:hypothetical protein